MTKTSDAGFEVGLWERKKSITGLSGSCLGPQISWLNLMDANTRWHSTVIFFCADITVSRSWTSLTIWRDDFKPAWRSLKPAMKSPDFVFLSRGSSSKNLGFYEQRCIDCWIILIIYCDSVLRLRYMHMICTLRILCQTRTWYKLYSSMESSQIILCNP